MAGSWNNEKSLKKAKKATKRAVQPVEDKVAPGAPEKVNPKPGEEMW